MQKLMLLFLSLHLAACTAGASPTQSTPQSDPGLQQELDTAAELNQSSAQLSVTQAQNAYFNVSGELLGVPLSVAAYQRLEAEVLPPMLAAANSMALSADEQLKADYQRLFNDISQQLLRGINNNLTLYQGLFETNQTLPGQINAPAETFEALTEIFQATEYTERYLTQLGQFSQLLPNSAQLVVGIQNQQAVVVNGVLKTLDQVKDVRVLQQGYQALVQTLTRPELLSVLTQLAVKVYGSENVARRQPELTPIQTNPNPAEAVIRESADQYRLIKMENGRLQHTVIQDSRGLSASDYLNQTTVVQVQNPVSP